MSSLESRIQTFLASGPYAVVGASSNQNKYGNKVLRCYLQHGREVYPIHPRAESIEGLRAYPSIGELPVSVPSISIITPPLVTVSVVQEAIRAGVERIWMQPGAEHPEAIKAAEEAGIEVISGGPCLLVVMGYHE